VSNYQDKFNQDHWFDEFIAHIKSVMANVHGCVVSTSLCQMESFPQVVVQRKDTLCDFADTFRVNVVFLIRTDYKGQKQEIDLINVLKTSMSVPINLKSVCVILLPSGEEHKTSDKKIKQVSLCFKMTVRFKG
jgi:hypothetical protein